MLCKACGYTHNIYDSSVPFLQLFFTTQSGEREDIYVYSDTYVGGKYAKELIYLYRCP